MGNNQGCCCCSSEEGAIKDKELDAYLRKFHTDKVRVTKFDAKDFFVAKQDFAFRTFRGHKNMLITDHVAKAQDMQVPESINMKLLSDMVELSQNLSKRTEGGYD